MSIIRTKRNNHVAALEPQPSDVAVVTLIGTARVVQPIQDYGKATDDAVAMADHMQAHVDVVPIDTRELLELGGMTPETLIASLSPAELVALRQDCVNACTDAIRYSGEPKVAAEAFAVLAKLRGAH